MQHINIRFDSISESFINTIISICVTIGTLCQSQKCLLPDITDLLQIFISAYSH